MRSLSRPTWQVIVAAVLAAAGLSSMVVFARLAANAGTEKRERAEALRQAQIRIPILLSYTHRDLRKDLKRAEEQTTGAFHRDYTELVNNVIVPIGEQKQISTEAAVTGAGVLRATGGTVVVLVFLTQTTTAPGASPSRITSAVVVTMRHAGATWKIAGLAPQAG